MTEKRKDVLSWDEYYMGVAILSGRRSKDPSTRVGACIVSPENKIVGVGYNGFPWGCSDDVFPWASEGDYLETKDPYVCHAELNAVLNAGGTSLKGARIYVAKFPCHECAKVIIQSGITEVIYIGLLKTNDSTLAAIKMFESARVKTRMFDTDREVLIINYWS